MGAGAFSSLMSAARSQSRYSTELAYRLEAMREMAKARGGHEGVSSMETYECYHLCQDCQRLAPPQARCTDCGGRTFLDLQNFGYARAQQEIEEEERRTAPTWAKTAGWLASFGTFVGLCWGSLIVCGAIGSIGILLFFGSIGISLGVAIAIGKALRKPLARLIHPRRTRQPLRKLKAERALGVAQGAGEENNPAQIVVVGGQVLPATPVITPLTKRPCRAYHLQVVLLDPEAMHKETWLLDEQVGAPGVNITGKLKEVRPLELRVSQVELHQLLRTRGLFVDEGELRFYESIVA